MSAARSRSARVGTPERDTGASRCRGDETSATACDGLDWNGHGPADVDCGEIAESGFGLGAFYAFQKAVRSIERS